MPHQIAGHDDSPGNQPGSALERHESPLGKRVLVIDDDDAVRQSLCAILTARGYEALEAESGLSALECLLQFTESIDAVILDLHMPGMNGREVLAALRSIHPHMPVILASGHHPAGSAMVPDARLRFVQKSHGPRALLLHLHELLQPAA
jgi:CheY-like chemotaxis protein